jgi:F0F1-type ATP synthase membrane subunit a
MIAGHALLKIFITISWVSFYFLHSFLVTLLLTWPLVIAFIFLEIVACILQALVLTSLVALYIDESVNFIYH